jgi:CrcB protein
MARFWVGAAVAAVVGAAFPWGTLLINVVGSFVIGLFSTLTASGILPSPHFDIRSFVMVGVCGGFTTFSSFSLQTIDLIQGGELVRAIAYVVSSVVLCLLSVWVGAIL